MRKYSYARSDATPPEWLHRSTTGHMTYRFGAFGSCRVKKSFRTRKATTERAPERALSSGPAPVTV